MNNDLYRKIYLINRRMEIFLKKQLLLRDP